MVCVPLQEMNPLAKACGLSGGQTVVYLLLTGYSSHTSEIQSNFSGSNTIGTMKIRLRRVVRANEC